MRVLVYPHDLALGGSQINATDLASAVSHRGHEVVVFGSPGPLVTRIHSAGLEFVPSPMPRRRPSPAVVSALADTVRRRDIDIVHGYEWPPALESSLVARATGRTAVSTILSMSVASFLPRTVPLLVGTEQIAQVERMRGRKRVQVLEPPVDLEHDCAEISSTTEFERLVPPRDDSAQVVRLVAVTRLVPELKLEGLLVAVDVVASMDRHTPVQLVIVGDGSERQKLERRAREINTTAGRPVVVLTGELDDPRPAYRSADIVLGMGGSVLRAMALGKPVVVQGERGFWRLLEPSSVDMFRYQGWYGVGTNQASGPTQLAAALNELVYDSECRSRLGRFAQSIVREHYSLDRAADLLCSIYEEASVDRHSRYGTMIDLGRSSTMYGRFFMAQRISRIRGTTAIDDFNSSPVAAAPRRMKAEL